MGFLLRLLQNYRRRWLVSNHLPQSRYRENPELIDGTGTGGRGSQVVRYLGHKEKNIYPIAAQTFLISMAAAFSSFCGAGMMCVSPVPLHIVTGSISLMDSAWRYCEVISKAGQALPVQFDPGC